MVSHMFGNSLVRGDVDYMNGMMGQITRSFGSIGLFWGTQWILGLVTWLLIITFLISLTRFFWLKGNEIDKKTK